MYNTAWTSETQDILQNPVRVLADKFQRTGILTQSGFAAS